MNAFDNGGDALLGYNRQHSEPGVVPGNSKWEIPIEAGIADQEEQR